MPRQNLRALRYRLTLSGMLAGGLLAVTQGVHAQTAPARAQDSAQRVAMNSSPTTALRPGDVLKLRIWREEDMSGDFPVDERGMAILPRLGPTQVTGVPAETLRQQLVDAYRQYLNNPTIEVTPLRRIAVIGAVRNPGTYAVDPAVTLGGAANVAGGATQQGKRNVLELRRGKERRQVDLEKNPELASLPLASGDQVFVPEKSWLSQNATWFVSTLVAIGTTTAIIIAN